MSNFREGLNALREISDPEKAKLILEKITGKKIADYEGVDALVGALMGYYNDEVKKKQNTTDNTLETIAKEIVPAINEEYKIIKGNSGVENIQHIQDNIIKEEGKGYFDNVTGKLYRCIKQAPANIITPDKQYFELADNISNSKKIYSRKEVKQPSVYTMNITEYREYYLINGKFYKSYNDNEIVVNLSNELPLADWATLSITKFMPASSVINNATSQMPLALVTYDIHDLKKGDMVFIESWRYDDNGFQMFVPKA